jgi:hypothetical protein
LVRVERVQYRWHKQKPYYAVRFLVLAPKHLAGMAVASRLYLTAKALWKLAWFLRDFGYDTELLGRDEIDEKRLTGLIGVIKVLHTTINGRSYLNLEAFATSSEWDAISLPSPSDARSSEPEVA